VGRGHRRRRQDDLRRGRRRGAPDARARGQHPWRLRAAGAKKTVLITDDEEEKATNEIGVFIPTMDLVPDIAGRTVTADALLTQTRISAYLHGRGVFERAGHYASWTPWDNRYGTEARLDAFFFPHAVDIADATSYISLFKDERYERHVELTRTGRSAAFLQLLLPARKDAPVPEVTDLSSDSFAAAQLTRADTADYFFLQPQPADQSLDDFTTDATFAWMRSTAGRWQQLAIREAVGFAAGSLTLTATSPATLALDAATPGLLRIAHPGDWMGARLELAYVGTDEVREVLANGQPIPYVRQEGHLIVGLGPLSRATTPVPDGIERLQAYPNPFQRQVMLEAPVRRPGTFAVNIYDMLGRHIVTLEGLHSPGSLTSRIAWNGRAASGTEVPAGVYLLRWTDAEGSLATGRVVRMR